MTYAAVKINPSVPISTSLLQQLVTNIEDTNSKRKTSASGMISVSELTDNPYDSVGLSYQYQSTEETFLTAIDPLELEFSIYEDGIYRVYFIAPVIFGNTVTSTIEIYIDPRNHLIPLTDDNYNNFWLINAFSVYTNNYASLSTPWRSLPSTFFIDMHFMAGQTYNLKFGNYAATGGTVAVLARNTTADNQTYHAWSLVQKIG